MVGDSAKHDTVGIPRLKSLGRINIAWNIEVVVILAYNLAAYFARELRRFYAMDNSIGNLTDVAGTKLVVLSFFDETL